MKPATELIHHGDGVSRDAEPLTTPIYETTTFLFENAAEVRAYNEGQSSKYLYSRYANPTVHAGRAEDCGARRGRGGARALERPGGDDDGADGADGVGRRGRVQLGDLRRARCTCSRICCRSSAIRPRFVSLERAGAAGRRCSRTRRSWSGSSRRSIRRCAAWTSRRWRAACKARGVISVVDNTFASPINQQPIALGVDLVMHSATKYLNGHSDVTAGALAGPARLMDPILDARKKLGTVLDPYAAYALGRGLKTLSVRMERHNANAMAVARWLSTRPARRRRSTIRASSSIPIMRLPRSRCAGSAGWCAWTSAAATIARRGSSIGCRSSSAPPASAASRACAACRC